MSSPWHWLTGGDSTSSRLMEGVNTLFFRLKQANVGWMQQPKVIQGGSSLSPLNHEDLTLLSRQLTHTAHIALIALITLITPITPITTIIKIALIALMTLITLWGWVLAFLCSYLHLSNTPSLPYSRTHTMWTPPFTTHLRIP